MDRCGSPSVVRSAGDSRRGGYGQERGASHYQPRRLDTGILKIWSEMDDAANLVLWMGKEHQQLEELLSQPVLADGKYRMGLKALDTAMSAQHQKEMLKKVLAAVSKSKFLNQMCQTYLMGHAKSEDWDDGDSVINSILKIVGEILEKLPEYAAQCFASLAQIQNMLPKIVSLSGNETIINATSEMANNAWKVQERRKEQAVALDSPPNDFTEMPVIPAVEELKKDSKPFVRAAVMEGAYKDLDHYLDVQFRLMREDFVQPLRKGLSEFVLNGCEKHNVKISDLRMYFDVRILKTKITNQVCHVLRLDDSKLSRVSWDTSKRLMEGSLICLSKDNFASVLFAIVCHRDVHELRNGRLTVAFQSGHQSVFESSPKDVYAMAETVAYFESYRPVLEGLKEMRRNMPLVRIIVKCEKTLKPPKYLLSGVHSYNISSIMETKTYQSVPVLNTSSWPDQEAVCLNESQLKAVQLALTKEVALIKGPPGTGKTFVGLKVVQLLLSNKDNMAGILNSGNDPILVICYTNHALDQFLEGILKFCPKEGVIRVGRMSESEKINEINLTNVKKSSKREHAKSCRIAWWAVICAMEIIKDALDDLIAKKENKLTDVLHEKKLKKFMASEHFDQITMGPDAFLKRKEKRMNLWLNAPAMPIREALSSAAQNHLLRLVLNWRDKDVKHRGKEYGLRNQNNLASAPIHIRATVYQQWLRHYKHLVMVELRQTRNPFERYNLRALIQSAEGGVLERNDFMVEVVTPDVLLSIINFVRKQPNCHTHLIGEDILKYWVLGSGKDISGQLDDIEALTVFARQLDNTKKDGFYDGSANEHTEGERATSDKDSDENRLVREEAESKTSLSALLHRASTLGIQVDDDDDQNIGDWVKVHHKKPSHSKTRHLLEKSQPMDVKEEKQVPDVWNLGVNTRFALYKLWLKRYEEDIILEMTGLVKSLKTYMKTRKEIESEESISILKDAKVIGMTTTGAAKNRAVLQAVGCRIVVVEEAAEVLEAHIVTALNKNCNHLILIGDHQQLRPNPTVYELAKHCNLDISLFERLIKNGVPHVSLTEQHRMRESISTVMRHIYPDLKDDVFVKTYKHVAGVAHDMFFIQHEELESSMEDTKSKSNEHEAKYLVGLCKYLLNQGYQPSQITILATYIGQVRTLKIEMEIQDDGRGQKDVCITTVDNFQGEENDIILLSLVRSNEENNVGFLKVDNRVCVALSRAKEGLFAIGNFRLLKSKSKLWTNILNTAASQNMAGDALPVACRNHPSDQMYIKTPSDFEKLRPEGGCGLPCGFRLPCGHACTLTCHGYDVEHEKFKCQAPCTKTVCDSGHPCRKKCFQECRPCLVKVAQTIPQCGHENTLSCSLDATEAICSVRCPAILDCEHNCSGKCGKCSSTSKHSDCRIQVEYTLPCGHTCKMACSQNPSETLCRSRCQAVLDCGHHCAGDCSSCLKGAVHKACASPCKLKLPCGHPCQSPCGLPCGPCALDCLTECAHSACSNTVIRRLCGDLCVPCHEPCSNGCRHQKCDRKCSEPCTSAPCSELCTNQVQACMHPCMGLCQELCVCGVCEPIQDIPLAEGQATNGDKQGKQAGDGKVEETKGEERMNENNPILIKLPSCNHVFQLNQLDAYLKNEDSRESGFLRCPNCATPIQKCFYFESNNKKRAEKRELLKQSLAREANVKSGQRVRLRLCLTLVQGSRNEWPSLAHMNEPCLSTSHQIKSASLMVRFAFVVEKIQSIQNWYRKSSLTLDQEEVKDESVRLKSLGPILTTQQVKEVKLELKRILLHKALGALSGWCTSNAVQLTPEMSSAVVGIQRSLQMPPLIDAVSEQATSLVKTLLDKIEEAEKASLYPKSQLIRENFDKAQEVLDDDNDKMLVDILKHEQRTPSTPTPLRGMKYKTNEICSTPLTEFLFKSNNDEERQGHHLGIDDDDDSSLFGEG